MELRCHTDQMNREIWLPASPRRIISLVPSQTEFLCSIGIGKRLVGRTLFCIHPAQELTEIPRVGGTKNLHLDEIRALQPDLIIGNKEENEKSQIEALSAEFPVWMSDVYNPGDAVWMMEALGTILHADQEAGSLIQNIKNVLDEVKDKRDRFDGISVLYAIWKSPWMFAGKDTFINSMLNYAGFTNLCPGTRYPEMSETDIRQANPACIFLSSEPYPFKTKHIEGIETSFPSSGALLVDGEVFSWYGSRMLKFSSYLDTLYTQIQKKAP